MSEQKLYSEHTDSLVALVTHLGMTRYKSRTPRMLAKYLSLSEEEVIYVLKNFKGLFRESISKCDYGQHYYTLQLRYARRWLEKAAGDDDEAEKDAPEPTEPLEPDYLSALLSFISNMVEQELTSLRQRSRNVAALVGAWIAAVAAVTAAIVGLVG